MEGTKIKSSITIAEVANEKSPFILQGRPFLESLHLAADYGFEAVEIQLSAPEKLDSETFFGCCNKLGLQLVSIATGLAREEGLSLSAHNEEVRLRSVERICKHIDLAVDCGHKPDIMIGYMIGRLAECPNRRVWRSKLGDSMQRISAYAVQREIGVNLEPVNDYDSDALNTWRDVAEFLDEYNCEHIKIGLDLYHMNIDEQDILHTISHYSDRIGCIQMMDDNRQVPGRGSFCFEKIVDIVKKTGYDGPITMECLPLPDANTALKEAANFYKRYFG